MELYNNIWTLIESFAYAFVILIFFMDPVRRWNFFGYRPTAIMGLFDPILGKVLIAKINGAWSFSQGGMYENNIYITTINVLKRELGISATRFKLIYTKPMGSVRLKNKNLIQRARISTISIFRTMRGKGYMACFLRAKLEDIEKDIKMGTGVQEIKVCTIEEAKKLVTSHTIGEHQPKKQKIILKMLEEIENYAAGVKDWETQNLDLTEIREAVDGLEEEKKRLAAERGENTDKAEAKVEEKVE